VFCVWMQDTNMRMLDSALKRGNVDALWMRNNLCVDSCSSDWIIETFTNDESPYAKYFLARALFSQTNDENIYLPLFRESYAGGCTWSWVYLSGEILDPFVQSEMFHGFDLIYRGAKMGECGCMEILIKYHSDKIPYIERAEWCGKCLLFSRYNIFKLDAGIAVDETYVIGREVEGYKQIYPDTEYANAIKYCIYYYLTCSHRARRAALQITCSFRARVGKDVARLIGQWVYRTRGPEWSDHERDLTDKDYCDL